MAKKKKYENKVLYNPEPPDIVRNYDKFDTLGSLGQKRYAGVFYEEFIKDLQGRSGIETYKEMSMNDDVIGSVLYAIEMIIRHVKWDVNPSGTTEADMMAAEFVKGCLDDMSQTWQDTISDILSFITYGWSWVEICYKVRKSKNPRPALSSKYNDGLIGWAKLPLRAQDTLWRWEYDEYDDLVGMTQIVPPDQRELTIPLEKSMHFVTKMTKGSPEGRSVLRTAYRDWYFKKRLQEIEGIGVERDLAGLPMLIPPEGLNIWDTTDPDMAMLLSMSEDLVRNVRRDEKEGVVIPPGWNFQLLSSGARRQFESGSIIERYDKRIATTVMGDFILLGQQSVGSFALSDSKTKLFSMSLETYLDIIAQVFNTQGIPRLIDLNGGYFKDITDYPKLVHGDIEQRDALNYLSALEKAIGIGIIAPDENLADYTRQVLNLPENVQADGENAEASQNEMKQDVDPEANADENAPVSTPLEIDDTNTGEKAVDNAEISADGEKDKKEKPKAKMISESGIPLEDMSDSVKSDYAKEELLARENNVEKSQLAKQKKRNKGRNKKR